MKDKVLAVFYRLLSSSRKTKMLVAAGTLAGVVVISIIGYTTTHYLMSSVSKNGKSIAKEYDPLPLEKLKGLEKVSAGVCKKMYKVTLPEQSKAKNKQELCSHGPDTAKSLGMGTTNVGGSYSVPCYGDGTSGKRIQAIYAVASGKPDRYDQLVPSFRLWAGYVDAMIDTSGQKTGSQLHARWLTDSACQLQVAKVVMTPTGDDDFGDTIAAVKDAGFEDPNRKYLIWTDDDWYCGIATLVDDDRKDPHINSNNGGPSYSRVDSPCWGNPVSAELHELFHNLGAVQNSAPHATGFFHCTDAYDVMCYKDTSTTKLQYLCPIDQAELLDCNNDDYLNSHPTEGSYLAGHWNTFDSGFLYSKIPTNEVPPSTPGNLTGKATSAGIALTWSASTDDEGKPITYKIYRQDPSGHSDLYATTSNTTYTDASVNPGSYYSYFVVAYDPSGNASAQSNTITVLYPSTPPPPADTTPPPALTNLSASNITSQGFTLSWSLPADTSDIKSIIVLLNDNVAATLNGTPTSTNLCCALQPDTSYTVRLKDVDASGNYSLSNQITVKTLAAAPVSNIPYNLTLVQTNGAEVTINANIATTVGAYIYRVTPVGDPIFADWLLPVTSSPQVRTFSINQIRPQNITGFYIAVLNNSSQETGRSATMAYSYGGSAESNPPSTPSNFSLSNITSSSALLTWDASSDDSGKVYTYHRTLTDNTTSTTSTLTSGYGTSATLPGLQSGHSYTAKVKAEDIWGNQSSQGTYGFTFP